MSEQVQVRIRHIHFSSLGSRSPLSLLRAVRIFVTLANVITFTEVSSNLRFRSLLNFAGWAVAHVENPSTRGEDECALLYRKRVFSDAQFTAYQLSKLPIPRRNDSHNFCLDVILTLARTHQLLLITLAHMPSGVQHGTRWNYHEEPGQVAVYKDSMLHWHERIRAYVESRRYAGIMVIADWNLDLRLEVWRKYIAAHTHLSLRTPWAGHMPTPRIGTHSRRVIDGTFTNLRLYRSAIRVLRRITFRRASDHRPYREVLLMPPATPVPQELSTFSLPTITRSRSRSRRKARR